MHSIFASENCSRAFKCDMVKVFRLFFLSDFFILYSDNFCHSMKISYLDSMNCVSGVCPLHVDASAEKCERTKKEIELKKHVELTRPLYSHFLFFGMFFPDATLMLTLSLAHFFSTAIHTLVFVVRCVCSLHTREYSTNIHVIAPRQTKIVWILLIHYLWPIFFRCHNSIRPILPLSIALCSFLICYGFGSGFGSCICIMSSVSVQMKLL